jgi:hypothetical protein
MLRARVVDTLGPRWTLVAATSVGWAAIVLGLLLPASDRVRATTALVGVAFLLGRRLLRIRHAPRDAQLVVGAGSIRLTHAGLLDQRVLASDVIAASTARTLGGVALAVVRRRCPERPLLLEFAAEEELDRVRRELGIGHRGFGVVSWPTASSGGMAAALLGTLWLAIATCAAVGLPELGLWMALPALLVTGLALLLAAIVRIEPGPRVALTEQGVLIAERWGDTAQVPYGDVVRVDVEEQDLRIETRTDLFAVRMHGSLRQEREHVAAQIRSAAQRTRGEGPPVPVAPASLAVLARRAETTHAWLERVDAVTASLVSSSAAYRRTGVDQDDLWTALETPDVPAPVRAAAARVLARVAPEEAKTRIAHVLARDHDDRARAYIRVALEDSVDAAARGLERIDGTRT